MTMVFEFNDSTNMVMDLRHNFITNFVRIRQICKEFTGNRANESRNVSRY